MTIFREKGFDHDADPANMMGIMLFSGLMINVRNCGLGSWRVEIRAEEGYAA